MNFATINGDTPEIQPPHPISRCCISQTTASTGTTKTPPPRWSAWWSAPTPFGSHSPGLGCGHVGAWSIRWGVYERSWL